MPKIIGYEKEGATYDIICHDMVLDAAKIYEIMPPDTKFIGLLRDPVYHFKSLWDANRHKVRFKIVINSIFLGLTWPRMTERILHESSILQSPQELT